LWLQCRGVSWLKCMSKPYSFRNSQDDEDYLPGSHSRSASQRQQQRPQHGQGQAIGEGGRARSLPGAPASTVAAKRASLISSISSFNGQQPADQAIRHRVSASSSASTAFDQGCRCIPAPESWHPACFCPCRCRAGRAAAAAAAAARGKARRRALAAEHGAAGPGAKPPGLSQQPGAGQVTVQTVNCSKSSCKPQACSMLPCVGPVVPTLLISGVNHCSARLQL
jgi:hypothetical protein